MEKSEMRKLAEFIEKLSWDDLPEEVKTTVSFRVLDLISAALGAVDDPLVKKVKASYLERNNGTGGKIWGSEGETDISTAAYINAMLAHTLELDDVHPASKTHGSASLIPAAWSCARLHGAVPGMSMLLEKNFSQQWYVAMKPSAGSVWRWE